MNKAHELLEWANGVSQYDNETATHLAKAVMHIVKAQQTGDVEVREYAQLWSCIDKLTRATSVALFSNRIFI